MSSILKAIRKVFPLAASELPKTSHGTLSRPAGRLVNLNGNCETDPALWRRYVYASVSDDTVESFSNKAVADWALRTSPIGTA